MSIFKKLSGIINHIGQYSTFDMFCALIVSAIDVAFPQILNWLTKGLFAQGTQIILRSLPWIALGLLVMELIRVGGQYFITSWGHIMGARMESNMRQDLFDHFQRSRFPTMTATIPVK